MNDTNLTPEQAQLAVAEQIMNQDAHGHWTVEKAPYLEKCFDRLTAAGTSAEAFHKFNVLTEILDIVDTPEYGEGAEEEDAELVAIADLISDYLEKSWTSHREGRLRVLREQAEQ